MLFNKPKKIIFIAKDKLTALEVVDTATKKFGKSFEMGWTTATLDLALSEVVKKFGSKEYRILVSDDLSYVVRMQLPASVSRENTRDYILEKLQEKIPDEISEGEWDYRQLKSKAGEERDVITFTLVKNFAKALSQAVSKVGLTIEAIESETISKTRDANAYIGLALKEDISGKDEDVLNLQPGSSGASAAPIPAAASAPTIPAVPVTSTLSAAPKAPGTGRRLSVKVLFFLIPIILIGALVGGFFYYRNNSAAVDNMTADITETLTEGEEPAVEGEAPPPADESTLKLEELKVQVQNGSGTPGEADRVSNLLTPVGITQITKGNASSFGFIDTEVSVKESAGDVYPEIEKALAGAYNVKESVEPLASDSGFDVVIIVGARK